MIEIKQLPQFGRWIARLKDRKARVLIASRLDRLAHGYQGDVKSIGQGVSELRIHH